VNVKVVPYSFAIARALGTKNQVICARSKGKSVFFDILLPQHEHKKTKLIVNFLEFPSVKFRKIWQTVNKYITLVGARFPGKSIRPVFLAAVKDINLKKIEKTALTNPTFFVFEIRIQLGAMCCENFRSFDRWKFKKIANKAIKIVKNTLICAFIN